MSFSRDQVHNFAAGPSPLPTAVLERSAQGLLNYNGTGMGICELSHRGKEFKKLVEDAEANLRKLLSIPDNYAVLFTQGGGTQQFSATLLNMLSYHRQKHQSDEQPIVDYVVTGSWSSKAATEAKRLVIPNDPAQKPLADIRIAASTKSSGFNTLPGKKDYTFSKDPAFVYYCENETINGVQFPDDLSSDHAFPFDLIPEHVPIVADYSSSFISRPIPQIERHAIIYAGAQKNLGPSGLTVVIVRKDILVDTAAVAASLGRVPPVPIELEYKVLADNGSLYNTPPTFPIYVSALVMEHLLEKGGMSALESTNRRKAEKLYAALEESEKQGLLRCKVATRDARSWMNVTFELQDSSKEGEFLAQAEARGFRQIRGHRSIGGIRVSLYNAVQESSVDAFCEFIKGFSN